MSKPRKTQETWQVHLCTARSHRGKPIYTHIETHWDILAAQKTAKRFKAQGFETKIVYKKYHRIESV